MIRDKSKNLLGNTINTTISNSSNLNLLTPKNNILIPNICNNTGSSFNNNNNNVITSTSPSHHNISTNNNISSKISSNNNSKIKQPAIIKKSI